MADPPLIVEPEVLARQAGIEGDLTPAQREVITDAILDAQDDVVAFLNRPIMPVTRVETGRWPYAGGWNLRGAADDDFGEIVSATPEYGIDGSATGYFTVTYTVGLNARDDPELRPIRRFVKAHAMNSPEFTRMWVTVTGTKGTVKNISVEGQGITFDRPTLSGSTAEIKPGSGEPGALPTLDSLDRWRLRSVYQAPSEVRRINALDYYPYGLL